MRKVLFLFLLLTLLPLPALAYVPPSQFVVKEIINKRPKTKPVKLRSTVLAVDGEKATGANFRETTIFDPVTHVLRSHAYDSSGKVLFSIERRGLEMSPADALLLEPNLELVTQRLKAAGLPIRSEQELLEMSDEEERRGSEVASIQRWKKDIKAWVLGWDKRGPALWVDKDSIQAVRLVADREGGPYDIRFEGYKTVEGSTYPRTVLVASRIGDDKSVFMRDELSDIGYLPEEKDAAELRKPLARMGFTAAGEAADAAVKELIRKYYQALR